MGEGWNVCFGIPPFPVTTVIFPPRIESDSSTEQLMKDVFHSQTPDSIYVLVCSVHASLLLSFILGVRGLLKSLTFNIKTNNS